MSRLEFLLSTDAAPPKKGAPSTSLYANKAMKHNTSPIVRSGPPRRPDFSMNDDEDVMAAASQSRNGSGSPPPPSSPPASPKAPPPASSLAKSPQPHEEDDDRKPAAKKQPSPPNFASSSGILPVLTANEVLVSRTLGKGSFCTVGAVKGLAIGNKNENNDTMSSDPNEQARQQLARRFENYEQYYGNKNNNSNKNNNASPLLFGKQKKPQFGAGGELPSDPAQPPRLALKQVQANLSAPKYERAIRDLTCELAVLKECSSHRHIISVHAVGYELKGSNNNNRVSFLLLDQLRSTLSNKVYTWREKRGALGVFLSTADWNQLWLERLIVLLRITDAVQHLHAQDILHRDLNLQNIGFDAEHVVKVFDLGLARKLNPQHVVYQTSDANHFDHNRDDALYKDMTAQTGTLRYMACEVALGLPYGKKADIHSLGIIFYEVLTLFKAYANVTLSAADFTKQVIQAGARPSLEAIWWPAAIKQLISEMWETDSAKRPSAKQVHQRLEGILRDSPEEELYPNKSHWTFGRDMNKTLTISSSKIKSWATGEPEEAGSADNLSPHGNLE